MIEDETLGNTVRATNTPYSFSPTSYFNTPLSPHGEWALSLQPGTKVLTKWDDRTPMYASDTPWAFKDSDDWHEATIRRTWESIHCSSGVLVSLQEHPDEWEYHLDSEWIRPLEETKND